MPLNPINSHNDIIDGLEALRKIDARLGEIIDLAGEIPLRRESAGFAELARIIIGQHVSTASANAIHGRFIDAIKPVTPQAFLDTELQTLIEIGLTRAKQQTLSGLSLAILEGRLDMAALTDMTGEDAISHMTSLKGIGPWTAEVYLLFCAGHPDIFAAGDLALREAVRHAFDMDERPSEKELRIISAKWAPYRGVASRVFWSYYAKVKGIDKGQPL